jgi:hypothetical protein
VASAGVMLDMLPACGTGPVIAPQASAEVLKTDASDHLPVLAGLAFVDGDWRCRRTALTG